MSLTIIRSAIVTELASWFPTLRAVEAHGGRFTERELPLLMAKAPCILVGCLSIQSIARRGEQDWEKTLRLAAYCLGADTAESTRDVLAMTLAEGLTEIIPDQLWGLPSTVGARLITPLLPELDSLAADNLYTGELNLKRIALWAVAWTQTFITETANV